MIAVLEENLHETEIENMDSAEVMASEISSYVSSIKYNSIPILNERPVISLHYDPHNSSRLLTVHHVSYSRIYIDDLVRTYVCTYEVKTSLYVICRKKMLKKKDTVLCAYGIFICRGDQK